MKCDVVLISKVTDYRLQRNSTLMCFADNDLILFIVDDVRIHNVPNNDECKCGMMGSKVHVTEYVASD